VCGGVLRAEASYPLDCGDATEIQRDDFTDTVILEVTDVVTSNGREVATRHEHHLDYADLTLPGSSRLRLHRIDEWLLGAGDAFRLSRCARLADSVQSPR
jgi:hypothetical protein